MHSLISHYKKEKKERNGTLLQCELHELNTSFKMIANLSQFYGTMLCVGIVIHILLLHAMRISYFHALHICLLV